MISGVVVVCRPEHRPAFERALADLEWAEIHHADARGRLVLTIEADGTEQSMERLQQVQSLPHVILAELAAYYVDDEPRL